MVEEQAERLRAEVRSRLTGGCIDLGCPFDPDNPDHILLGAHGIAEHDGRKKAIQAYKEWGEWASLPRQPKRPNMLMRFLFGR